jgi:hypothetical protein
VKVQSSGNYPGLLSASELDSVIAWIKAGALEKELILKLAKAGATRPAENVPRVGHSAALVAVDYSARAGSRAGLPGGLGCIAVFVPEIAWLAAFFA